MLDPPHNVLRTTTTAPLGRSNTTHYSLLTAHSSDHRERNKIVMKNIGLVNKIAGEYARRSTTPFEDLFQLGTIGLIKAVERFKPERRIAFSCYAYPYIKGEIQHYFNNTQVAPIKIPRELKAKGEKFRSCSLDEWIEIHGRIVARHEIVPDERATRKVEVAEDFSPVVSAISRLDSLTSKIITLVYHHDLTKKQTSKLLGVTQVTVSRRLTRGLTQLKAMLAKELN